MKNNKVSIGKIIYVSAALALAVFFVLFVLEKTQVTNFYSKPVSNEVIYEENPVNKIDYSPADPTENDEINNKKESGELTNDNVDQTQPGEPIDVVLTAAGQDNVGGPVVVRVLLTDVNNGTCSIKISKDDVVKQFNRQVVNAGTYYNCEALDIPVSELSQGQWNLDVSVVSGDRSGTATASVEVKL